MCHTDTVVFLFSVSQMEDGSIQRDFGKVRTSAQVTEALLYFTRSQRDILVSSMLVTLHQPFFRKHVLHHILIFFISIIIILICNTRMTKLYENRLK